MGDNWDDDDFEIEEVPTFVKADTIAPAVPVEQKKAAAAPKVEPKTKKAPVFAMESLGRELSGAEKEAIQKKNDLALAREMFGGDVEDDEEVGSGYANISTKEEFEYWGERIGGFLATRNKASNYGDMIGKLLISITESLTPADITKMSTLLTQISAAKKTEEKKAQAKAPVATSKKAKGKASLKTSKATDNMYDDYGGAADDYDDYDDFM